MLFVPIQSFQCVFHVSDDSEMQVNVEQLVCFPQELLCGQFFHDKGLTCCCCCLLLQYLIQSCACGGRRIVEDMCYEI